MKNIRIKFSGFLVLLGGLVIVPFVACDSDKLEKDGNSAVWVGDCMKDKNQIQMEFVFRFEAEKLVIEHRNVMLNCGDGDIVNTIGFQNNILTIKQKEVFAPGVPMANCICPKNIGYQVKDIKPTSDSIKVDYSFESGHYQFKIPSKGEGSVLLEL